MTLADRIERTMVLPAQRQRAWEAVTKPEQLARWFGVVSDMDFRSGAICLRKRAPHRRRRKNLMPGPVPLRASSP